jgi:hypothetical protein
MLQCNARAQSPSTRYPRAAEANPQPTSTSEKPRHAQSCRDFSYKAQLKCFLRRFMHKNNSIHQNKSFQNFTPKPQKRKVYISDKKGKVKNYFRPCLSCRKTHLSNTSFHCFSNRVNRIQRIFSGLSCRAAFSSSSF